MADTYFDLVKAKEEELSARYNRMDGDKDLLYLKKYVMMDAQKVPKAVPDIVNVTLNLPGRFFNDVISTLGTAKEQSIVETEDKQLDTTYIEDFREASFGAANARLRLQGKFELNPWWDFHSCSRGGAAARCVFRMGEVMRGDKKEEALIPDIAQWDIRYVSYAIGANGLDWGAYKTMRKKDVIEAEPWAVEKGFILPAKQAEVIDVWDTEHNEIWVAGDKVFEQEHTYGFCPVVIQFVVIGSMLADEDSLEHQGESVFFLIRDAVPELERLISIMQTLNLKGVKPPMVVKVKGSKKVEDPEALTAMSSVTSVEPDEKIEPISYGDAQRSAQLAYSIMRESIKEATVAASELGVIESPPASGVRAMVAGESRDQLLSPRLGLRALMNQGLADMFTAQVIQLGGSVEIGTPGHTRTFQTSKLDGQYEGYYKYTIKSAAVDAGRASLAAAYGDAIPKKAKLVEIYQREDPDGDERQLRWEEIERLVPAIKINRDVRALLEMAERGDENAMLEAEIASAQMGVSLQQMLAGETGELPPEKEDEPTQVLSLFGGNQGGGRQPPPAEEKELE